MCYAKIEDLRKIIAKYNYYYYIKNLSLVSDYEFDLLMYELKNLEEEYPEYYNEDSPTQKIYGYFDKIGKNF